MKNNPIWQLKNSIVRLADSAGMDPGTNAYHHFVWNRLSVKQFNTMQAVGKDVSALGMHDRFLSEMDIALVEFRDLRGFANKCRRNGGLSRYGMSIIMNTTITQINRLGRNCVEYQVTEEDPVKKYLTGVESFDPDECVDPRDI